MLCPTGYSFYRPFSFRRQYLSRDLQNVVANPEQIRANLSLPSWNTGFVGMRFGNAEHPEFRNKFIPLRRVTLTSIQEDDAVQVFFKVGDYVCPSDKVGAIDLDGIVDTSKPETTLFFSVPSEKTTGLKDIQESDKFPQGLWESLMAPGAISPKAQDNLADTLILRFGGYHLHGTSKKEPPQKIENGGERGDIFGPKLIQGRCYDFQLVYSRIARVGQVRQDIPRYQYEWVSQGDILDVVQNVIPVTGNYRMETVWAEVQRSSPAPIELRFIPAVRKTEGTVTQDDQTKAIELRLWVLSVAKFWNRQRAVSLGMFLAFLLASIVFAYSAADKSKVYLGALAASAGLCASFFKDFVMGRGK